jgi:hypothetical protein
MTGIGAQFFFQILDELKVLHLITPTSMSSDLHLLLILHWLHEMPKFKILGQMFQISKSLAHSLA